MTNLYKNDELPTSNIYPNMHEWKNVGEIKPYTPSSSTKLKENEVSNEFHQRNNGKLPLFFKIFFFFFTILIRLLLF